MAGQAAGLHGPMITLVQPVADLTAAPDRSSSWIPAPCSTLSGAAQRDLAGEVRAGIQLRALAATGTVRLFVQDSNPLRLANTLGHGTLYVRITKCLCVSSHDP